MSETRTLWKQYNLPTTAMMPGNSRNEWEIDHCLKNFRNCFWGVNVLLKQHLGNRSIEWRTESSFIVHIDLCTNAESLYSLSFMRVTTLSDWIPFDRHFLWEGEGGCKAFQMKLCNLHNSTSRCKLCFYLFYFIIQYLKVEISNHMRIFCRFVWLWWSSSRKLCPVGTTCLRSIITSGMI